MRTLAAAASVPRLTCCACRVCRSAFIMLSTFQGAVEILVKLEAAPPRIPARTSSPQYFSA